MRMLVPMARPGVRLGEAVLSADGLPLFGRGTELTRRHLRLMHEAGVRSVEVAPDPSIEPWQTVPETDAFLRALNERFAPVESDRRMMALKEAVRDVYLDFLLELESGP
jgi:hypothetical protein